MHRVSDIRDEQWRASGQPCDGTNQLVTTLDVFRESVGEESPGSQTALDFVKRKRSQADRSDPTHQR